jgi:menaquinol-cytochrome c reductase iron-sulfur subunit
MSMPISRRQFLSRGTGALAGLITALLSVPALGFLLSPLWEPTKYTWITVGPIDSIPEDSPTALVASVPIGSGPPAPSVNRIVYIVKHQGALYVFSNVCTHMQCDVHWDAGIHYFLCPCHGGLYTITGQNIGGPPPKPLPQWVHRIQVNARGQHVVQIQNRLAESI